MKTKIDQLIHAHLERFKVYDRPDFPASVRIDIAKEVSSELYKDIKKLGSGLTTQMKALDAFNKLCNEVVTGPN